MSSDRIKRLLKDLNDIRRVSDQLPEWSKDDEPDYDCFGSFDASGAFRENQQRNKEKDEAAGKISKEREQLEARLKRFSSITTDSTESSDAKKQARTLRFGTVTKDTDKALKSTDENHNKNDETPPKHSISSHDDIQSTESIAEELWDVDDVKESNVLSLTVSSSSNSSLSSNFSSSNKQSSDQSNSGFDHKTKPDPCVNVPKSDNKIITHETDDTKCDESVVNNRINNNPPQEADFDHLQKAAESLMAKWIEEEEAKTSVSSSKPSLPVLPPKASTQQSSCSTQKTVIPLPLEDKNALKWYYCDPQGQVQGPFVSEEMSDWLNAGYFNMSLLIRRGCDNKFLPLGDLMKLWGRSPFREGCPDPPPIRCSNAVPEAQKQKQPVSSESGGVSQPTKENEDLRLLQQQLLPYQLVQQRFLQEQQNLLRQQVQVMNQLEQRGFELLLNHQQQQQLLLQYIIAQQLQQQQRPLAAVPETATSTSVPQDPVQQFLSRVAFAHHPLLDLWPGLSRPTPNVRNIDNRSQSIPSNRTQQLSSLTLKNYRGENKNVL
ncbi:GIGYF1 (predicted) [Pycnogonum litorale]